MGLSILNMDDFREIIQRHDASNQIKLLRKMVNQNKDALADYLLVGSTSSSIQSLNEAMAFGAYPGSSGISKREFIDSITAVKNERVFDPWNGWWTGKWSNNANQFHIWDRTVFDSPSQQWVQPVTQSTSGFAWKRTDTDQGDGIQVSEADVAINVWSSKNGITGWVSKKDGNELPHVGYSVNQNTLIWFTIYGNDYFMFLEKVIEGGKKYSMYGRPFTVLGSKLVVNPANIHTHNGTYESHKKLT